MESLTLTHLPRRMTPRNNSRRHNGLKKSLSVIRRANGSYYKKLLDSFLQPQVKILLRLLSRMKRFKRDSFAFYKFIYGILVNGKDLPMAGKRTLLS